MRGTEYLHLELQSIAKTFLAECEKAGLNVLITETFRMKIEQDTLYAKGRTAAGSIVTNCQYPYSPHCWGVAFDFCRNVKGWEYDDSDGFFEKVGAIGKRLGLFWGGDFKSFTDKPHLELQKYLPNNSVKTLIAKYGTPENFKKTWEAEEVVKKDVSLVLPSGKLLTIKAIIDEETTYSPIRAVLEAMGYVVGWEDGKITVNG